MNQNPDSNTQLYASKIRPFSPKDLIMICLSTEGIEKHLLYTATTPREIANREVITGNYFLKV